MLQALLLLHGKEAVRSGRQNLSGGPLASWERSARISGEVVVPPGTASLSCALFRAPQGASRQLPWGSLTPETSEHQPVRPAVAGKRADHLEARVPGKGPQPARGVAGGAAFAQGVVNLGFWAAPPGAASRRIPPLCLPGGTSMSVARGDDGSGNVTRKRAPRKAMEPTTSNGTERFSGLETVSQPRSGISRTVPAAAACGFSG